MKSENGSAADNNSITGLHIVHAEQDWLLSNPSLNNLLDLVRHERQNGSYQWAVIYMQAPYWCCQLKANKFLLVFYSARDSLPLCYHFTRRNKKPSPCMSGYDVDTTYTIPQRHKHKQWTTYLFFSSFLFSFFIFHFIHVVVSVSPATCMHVRVYFVYIWESFFVL